MRTRMVDQNPSESTRRDSEEMGSAAPLRRLARVQTQIKLVDERGRLQRMIAALGGKHARRNPMQFGIEGPDNQAKRLRVFLGPSAQILRHWRIRAQDEMILQITGIR
jgi:hypothetical protein